LTSLSVSEVNSQAWKNFEILTTFSSEDLKGSLYINADHKEMGWDTWIHMAQWQTLVNMEMKVLFPQKVQNFLKSSVTVSFSKRTPLHGIA
jgi:hypothetical protein